MAAPTNYVIKVYDNEAHAIEGGTTNALAVTGGSDYTNMISQDAQGTYNFHTHERYYYRIEANGPIKSIYIDWGDGEDRDPKSEANYQYVSTKGDEEFVVVDHIYTDHKLFFPIIKAVNNQGFESKYYTPSWGATNVILQTVTVDTVADVSDSLDGKYFDIYDGDNQQYRVWIDTDNSGTVIRIPDGVTSTEVTGITTGMGANDVASQVRATVNALSNFTASVGTNRVTIQTTSATRHIRKPDAGTSGFTVDTTVFGNKNDVSTLEPNAVIDPRDPTRNVEVDSQSSPRIPSFMPAAVPPVARLKVDRSHVFSGIDNGGISIINNPRGYAYLDGKDAYDAAGGGGVLHTGNRSADINIANLITVTYKDVLGNINTETISASTVDNHDAAKFCTTNNLQEILEVRVNNMLEGDASNLSRLFPREKVHILIYSHDNTSNDPEVPIGSETTEMKETVTACHVSLGNPIVTAESSEYTVVADGSSSYSRHSNEKIEYYNFDTGKLTDGFSIANSDDATQVSPVLQYSNQESPIKKVSYSFDIFAGDQTDSYNRFYDTERLIRLQVEQDSDDFAMTSGDTKKYSFLDHWDVTNFNDGTAEVPEYLATQGLMQFFSEGSGSDIWTDVGSVVNNANGNSFTNGTCDYNNDPTIDHDADSRIVPGLLVSGPGIPAGAFVQSVNSTTSFEIGALNTGGAVSTTGGSRTNQTLTFTGKIFGGPAGTMHSLHSATPISATADNFLLMVKKHKFNKIYFRMDNDARFDNVNGGNSEYEVKLSLMYTSPDGWRPLKFRDTTVPHIPDGVATGYGQTFSLQTSGSITFDMPQDWISTIHDDVEIAGGILVGDEPMDVGTVSPNDQWTDNGFGLLLAINVNEATNVTTNCVRVHTYDNSFSQLIKVIDPMCISINSIGVTQSLSFKRGGTYVSLNNRLGKKELRRIGVSGGSIRFGSIDLSGTTDRDTVITHQKQGNRVYYDFKRPDGSFVRFYGIITDVSEDLPVGLQHPKLGIDMNVEYIIEYTSAGIWTKKHSLGGEVIDEPRFSIQT